MTVTTVRADALNPTADLAQAAAVYNDATHLLEGGLWQQPANQGNQTPSLTNYLADLKALGADAQAAAQTFAAGSASANDLATIASLTQTLSAAAQSAVGARGAALTAAETALHDGHLQIQNLIANNPELAAAATANGATGFLAAPSALAAGITAATAPHAAFADLGALFNDAANQLVGGINPGNHAAVQADLKAVAAGLQDMLTKNPGIFTEGQSAADAATTLLHVQTIENQLQLQIHTFDNSQSGLAHRGSNDNMLDIIDIVQGDAKLQTLATADGSNGFATFGNLLSGTGTRFQDNAAQTKFWANFIVGANTINADANALVGSSDTHAVQSLIGRIHAYEQMGAQFTTQQGGIFAARFANELGPHAGTLAADAAMMIKGLQTGDAAMVQAAGAGMVADAADVSGNNVPVGGGTFNTAGTTVAQVLSTAGTMVASNGGPGHGGNGQGGTGMPVDPGANGHVATMPPIGVTHEADASHAAHAVFQPNHYWG